MATSFERGARRSPPRSATRCWCGPSYVLGGRGMEIVYDDDDARGATSPAPPTISPEHPVLVDRFLDDAVEIDVDALFDGTELYLGGVMEHIEEAGIHSGDSACALPPITLGPQRDRRGSARATEAIAARRRRARPAQRPVRARRPTCSTCSRPTRGPAAPCRSCPRRRRCRWPRPRPGSCSARPIAELRDGGRAARRPATAATCRRTRRSRSRRRCCRSTGSAPPTGTGVDTVLGPEMKSTGEVMGFDADFGTAFAKSQAAAYGSLPDRGHGVRVGGQPRQARDDLPGQAAGRPRLRDPRHRGHRRGAAPQRRRVRRSCASTSRARRRRRADDRRR